MAQVNVLSLSNALSSAFRANLNSVLAALFSTNSGAAFPTTTAPGMLHVNTSGGTQTLWMRNAADTAWVQVSYGASDQLTLGSLSLGAPVTITADRAIAVGENYILNNKAGSTLTLTLPAPGGANSGRVLRFLNRQARAVVSATANVVPQGGGAASTAILPAVVGAQCDLVSDGANWLMFESGAFLSAFGQQLGTAADAAAGRSILGAGITLGTSVATTSGTAVDFTGIPAGVRRITVMFNGISFASTGQLLLQVGAGAVSTTGYVSCASSSGGNVASTAGFLLANAGGAVETSNGSAVLLNPAGNTWVQSGNNILAAATRSSAGAVTLGGVLDRVRLTSTTGDTFDAGSVNIAWEF